MRRAFILFGLSITLFSNEDRNAIMKTEHSFSQFLNDFVPAVSKKSRQLNQSYWILSMTGSQDAADLQADLSEEYRMLFTDKEMYEALQAWEAEGSLRDPVAKRQLNVLVRTFKSNQVPKDLLAAISQKEAQVAQLCNSFRAEVNKKTYSENEIREVLKNENQVATRKAVWDASKQIGQILAPEVLALVDLRNQTAHHLGYSDFFKMQLDLQEVDEEWLLRTFDELAAKSDAAYLEMLDELEAEQARRFKVDRSELGPWAWSEPFCQEDPFDAASLDPIVQGVDLSLVCTNFYKEMGFDIHPILERSDLYEKPQKCQHAFCINIDRSSDVRTLNNLKPSIKWLETLLHEVGHAIYEIGFDSSLPWLLREPPHMITTEAMALIAGRQAYRAESLPLLVGSKADSGMLQKAEQSLRRRQLIFSRWVFVMTAFERELYRDPHQDLNALWWSLVQKYQKITPPSGREGKADWAAKYHIANAPVYYFSYLLGEMFASAMQEAVRKEHGSVPFASKEMGQFFHTKLFHPGNRMSWSELVEYVTGEPLTPDAWVREFGKAKN